MTIRWHCGWVQVTAALERLGGVSDAREIAARSSRRKLRVAVDRGEVVRVRRGYYALCSASAGSRPRVLLAAARAIRGRGAGDCVRVALEASALAANPFESVLRAIVLDIPELAVVPQGPVTARGHTWHPDLTETRHRLAIEADSFEFHTDREAHARDCVRYNALTVAGWRVLRFTWDQVMTSPGYVRGVLAGVLLSDAAA